MIRQVTLIFALVAASGNSAADPLPKDVQVFVSNAETCEHMAGEWDGGLSKARRREITRAIKKYCAPAKRQLPVLMKKYQGNPYVLGTISEYAYDSVKSYTEIDK